MLSVNCMSMIIAAGIEKWPSGSRKQDIGGIPCDRLPVLFLIPKRFKFGGSVAFARNAAKSQL
jgi:hypothetical protein